MLTLTQAILKEYLHYNYLTGIFTWIKKPSQKTNISDVVGCLSKKDHYIRIKFKGHLYLAHRLAWLYIYGVWPKTGLDHEDTIGNHNWISNLREATKVQNSYNVGVSKRNTSGFAGVHPSRSGRKWHAVIRYNKKPRFLGSFNTPEEAAAQYQLFAEKIHGEFLHESLKKDILK